MKLLLLTTLLCAAANAGAEELPRNSGGRGAAPPVDAKPSAGPLSLDSEDLPMGHPIMLVFASGSEIRGIKDPVYGFMNHNGVALDAKNQPTGWKPLPS